MWSRGSVAISSGMALGAVAAFAAGSKFSDERFHKTQPFVYFGTSLLSQKQRCLDDFVSNQSDLVRSIDVILRSNTFRLNIESEEKDPDPDDPEFAWVSGDRDEKNGVLLDRSDVIFALSSRYEKIDNPYWQMRGHAPRIRPKQLQEIDRLFRNLMDLFARMEMTIRMSEESCDETGRTLTLNDFPPSVVEIVKSLAMSEDRERLERDAGHLHVIKAIHHFFSLGSKDDKTRELTRALIARASDESYVVPQWSSDDSERALSDYCHFFAERQQCKFCATRLQ